MEDRCALRSATPLERLTIMSSLRIWTVVACLFPWLVLPARSATVDGFAEGETQTDLFVEHPDLVGTVTVEITSECSWALSFVRYQG